jgi:PHD/YefM family antitoxin component YafN of YafNO toxin-antitoxin module
MLIRKHSRRAEAEAQWRAEVSAQLVLLMDAQAQMAEVASLHLKDRERRRPGWPAWAHAILLLVLSGSVVLSGIVNGIASTTEAAAASSLQAQANSAITQVDKATQPVISLANRKGAAWVVAHATKADVSDLTTAEHWAKIFHGDSYAASADQSAADREQLTGPALLTFGSALGGAVLGWMLTQWLGSLRWPKKGETRG